MTGKILQTGELADKVNICMSTWRLGIAWMHMFGMCAYVCMYVNE